MRIVRGIGFEDLEILQACFYNRLHLVSSDPPVVMDLPKHQRRRPSPEILGFGFGFGVLLKECKSLGRWGSDLLLWRGMCSPGQEDSPLFSDVGTTCKEGLTIEAIFWRLPSVSHREICVFRLNRKTRRVFLMRTTCKGLKIEADSEITFRSRKDTATLTMGTPTSVSYFIFISSARYVFFRNRKNSPFFIFWCKLHSRAWRLRSPSVSHHEICVFRNRKAHHFFFPWCKLHARGLKIEAGIWDYLPFTERHRNVNHGKTWCLIFSSRGMYFPK